MPKTRIFFQGVTSVQHETGDEVTGAFFYGGTYDSLVDRLVHHTLLTSCGNYQPFSKTFCETTVSFLYMEVRHESRNIVG